MLEFIYPRNDRLKKYIRYIYRFTSDDENFQRELMIFPNVGSAITIYKDASFVPVTYSEFHAFGQPGYRNVIFHLNRKDPVLVKEKGRQNRIVIVFNPLGINHFIPIPVSELVERYNPSLVPAIPVDERFTRFCDIIASDGSLVQCGEKIEELLLSQLNDFDNAFLQNCVSELMNMDDNKKMEEVALMNGASAKTMNRLFHKYIGLSPVEFRRIIQFRNAVRVKLENNRQRPTDIALESNYYDLPYMSKVFKQMTGIPVADFFERLSFSADRQYVYIA